MEKYILKLQPKNILKKMKDSTILIKQGNYVIVAISCKLPLGKYDHL